MKKLSYYFSRIKLDDFKSILYILIGIVPAKIIKVCKQEIWTMAERPNVADGNSLCFFQWVCEKYPEQNVYFFLDKKAHNFDSSNKKMVGFGSFRHYIYYLASDYYISDFLYGVEPNRRICDRYDKKFKKKLKQVYLKHGIVKDSYKSFSFEKTRARLFVCGTAPEYEYLQKHAGYPEGHLVYTGLARFDELLLNKKDKRYILLIPTWRRYIGDEENPEEYTERFLNSEYFKTYCSLLFNKRLHAFLQENNLKLKFCIHEKFRRFVKYFESETECIEIVGAKESIHQMLSENSMVITDYSSVFFDAAYAEKPIIYYQFDYDEYRKKHFEEGYFSYEDDGFGPIAYSEEELLDYIEKSWNGLTFERDKKYIERSNSTFALHDTWNCQRIYEEIKKIDKDERSKECQIHGY